MSNDAKSPGDAIKAALEARGWTQTDLAQIVGRHLPAISEIINGKRSITPDMAVALGSAFGNEADYWMHLDGSFRLSLLEPDADVERRAKIYSIAPVAEMEKRGWIRQTETVADLEKELCGFFAVTSLEQEPAFEASTRKSGATTASTTPAQRAWFARGARMASVLQAQRFSPSRFEKGLPAIRNLAAHPEGAKQVARALADLGVRLVVVEPLAKTKIDGAAFWLDEEKPVIMLSVRFDRIDGFWHTLSHEISHIRHGDSLSVDADIFGEDRSQCSIEEKEVRADREAADFLIPKPMLDSFILRVRPLYSKVRIIQFANRVKVHPGIVTGQLQYRKELSWTANREMLAKVRSMVTSTALTDGWGCTVPAL
jgi:HTH-type transcriptional regulator / antitoxin HigA